MKAMRANSEEAAMGNDGRNEMLRSTPNSPKNFMSMFKAFRQQTAANDPIVSIERSAA